MNTGTMITTIQMYSENDTKVVDQQILTRWWTVSTENDPVTKFQTHAVVGYEVRHLVDGDLRRVIETGERESNSHINARQAVMKRHYELCQEVMYG